MSESKKFLQILNLYLIFSAFSVRKRGHECGGDEENVCLQPSKDECARICKTRASLFAYGMSKDRCQGNKCKCICETAAKDGQCSEISSKNFNLYQYD